MGRAISRQHPQDLFYNRLKNKNPYERVFASECDIPWSKAESNGVLARPLIPQANVLRCFGPKGACPGRRKTRKSLALPRSGIRQTRSNTSGRISERGGLDVKKLEVEEIKVKR